MAEAGIMAVRRRTGGHGDVTVEFEIHGLTDGTEGIQVFVSVAALDQNIHESVVKARSSLLTRLADVTNAVDSLRTESLEVVDSSLIASTPCR